MSNIIRLRYLLQPNAIVNSAQCPSEYQVLTLFTMPFFIRIYCLGSGHKGDFIFEFLRKPAHFAKDFQFFRDFRKTYVFRIVKNHYSGLNILHSTTECRISKDLRSLLISMNLCGGCKGDFIIPQAKFSSAM